jgi:hypothetical protein
MRAHRHAEGADLPEVTVVLPMTAALARHFGTVTRVPSSFGLK